MPEFQGKTRAFFIHFLLSAVFALGAGAIIVFCWYPSIFLYISNGTQIILLIAAVDVVLGPLISLVIFSKKKSARALVLDYTAIGVLQIAALGYGLWTAYESRPQFLVFEYKNFYVVHASDLGENRKFANEFKQQPKSHGIHIVSLRPPRNGTEQLEIINKSLGGLTEALQFELWQPYALAISDIKAQCKELAEIKNSVARKQLDAAVKESPSSRSSEKHCFLPVIARQQVWTASIDKATGQPTGFFPIDTL
ncbi:MAG: pilus assembly protein [Acidovorax sp.]|uniref:pilus assembly protein n=1 Tax=Acidovorax sp. TaxID=1872122 RepID=UPI0022C5A421|nr:pilus assembly protein [Acidovorax sp.]MCZ8220822.1 pilus assembly protein [Acidovorax sp.]